MKRLLIAGCGDLGVRLAARLEPDQWQCHGLRRQAEKLPNGIIPIRADLLDPASLQSAHGEWDAVIYQATPAQRSPEAYRQAYIDGLGHILAVVKTPRLIFISSTAVFGQDDGEWVDEDATTEPSGFSGQVLLQAEQLALNQGGLAVRFSGIYSPGRDALLRRLRQGRARGRIDPPQWTNRIHADDCAAVLQHLLEQAAPHALYCASDCQPAPRWEVLSWLAERYGLPAPQEDQAATGMGKRVSNRRLLASGFRFQYPDYLAGYTSLLP